MNMAAPRVLATSMGAMMFSMRWTASSYGRATSKMMPICINSAMRATDPTTQGLNSRSSRWRATKWR